MQHKMQHEKKETLISQGFQSGDGGIRTPKRSGSYRCYEQLFFWTFPIMQHKMQHEKKETLISQGFQSGDGGIRTHGRFDPSTDFESASL